MNRKVLTNESSPSLEAVAHRYFQAGKWSKWIDGIPSKEMLERFNRNNANVEYVSLMDKKTLSLYTLESAPMELSDALEKIRELVHWNGGYDEREAFNLLVASLINRDLLDKSEKLAH